MSKNLDPFIFHKNKMGCNEGESLWLYVLLSFVAMLCLYAGVTLVISKRVVTVTLVTVHLNNSLTRLFNIIKIIFPIAVRIYHKNLMSQTL